jgi:cytochrome bd-type quinol oxidase subunit 2
VRRGDWERIRRCVARLKNPVPYLTQVGWTFVGVCISSGLAYLAWRGTEAQLNRSQKYDNRWVTPTLVVVSAAAALIAILAFVTAAQVRRQTRVDVDELLVDMDSVYPQQVSREALRAASGTTGSVRLRRP